MSCFVFVFGQHKPSSLYPFTAGVSQIAGTYQRFALQWTVRFMTVLSASRKALRCCLWCRTPDPGAHCIGAACDIEARQLLSAILKNLYAVLPEIFHPMFSLFVCQVGHNLSRGVQCWQRAQAIPCPLSPSPSAGVLCDL